MTCTGKTIIVAFFFLFFSFFADSHRTRKLIITPARANFYILFKTQEIKWRIDYKMANCKQSDRISGEMSASIGVSIDKR